MNKPPDVDVDEPRTGPSQGPAPESSAQGSDLRGWAGVYLESPTLASGREHAATHIGFLQELPFALLRERDPREMIRATLLSLVEHLEADGASFGMFAPDGAEVMAEWSRGPGTPGPDGRSTLHLLARDLGALPETETTVVVDDIGRDPRTAAHLDALRRDGTAALLGETLITAGGLRSVLSATSHRPRSWRPDEVQLLRDVALRLVPAFERLRAEVAMRTSEEHLHLFLQHAPAAVAMFDRDMRYIVASDRWLDDYRLRGRNIIGQCHYDVSPELPERWRSIHRRALAGETIRCEEDSYRHDGYEDWLRWEVLPWLTAQREIGGVILFSERLSERKRAEQELRDGQTRVRAIVEQAVDALITIDDRGVIESFNPAAERMFGYVATEVVGRNVGILMRPADRVEHDAHLARYLHSGTPRILGSRREVEAVRKDGTTVPVDLVVSELRIGGQLKFIGTMRDLSERNRLHAQYLQAQKMEAIARLAAGVAHDFNNLLAGVRVGLGVAMKRLDAGHPALPLVREIDEEVARGATITRRLLDYSRRDAAVFRPVDVCGVVCSTEQMIRRLLGEDIRVEVECNPEEGRVLADAGLLEQALLNLAVNARDAMPRGGTLRITCSDVQLSASDLTRLGAAGDPGRYVVLSVQDTGVGMDPATRARATEAFFTTKGVGSGTGLGLSTVDTMVRSWRGWLEISSEVGAGTTVQLYLPRTEAAQERRIQADEVPPGHAPGGESILVVEDEKLVRLGIQHILEDEGYRVLPAESPVEALAHLQSRPDRPHLILTDVVLPGMNGPELVQAARQIAPGLRALFMSAFPYEDLVARGRIEPGTLALEKPFSGEEMCAKVRAALAQGEHPTR